LIFNTHPVLLLLTYLFQFLVPLNILSK